jgi:hypothetical protein
VRRDSQLAELRDYSEAIYLVDSRYREKADFWFLVEWNGESVDWKTDLKT